MQGAAKNPKFGHRRKSLAPAMGLRDSSLAARTCCQPGSDRSHPACPRLPATAPRPGTHHSLLLPLELEADVLGPEEAKGADLQLRMKLLPAPGDGQATRQPSAGTGGRPGSAALLGLGARDPLCPLSTSSSTRSRMGAPGAQPGHHRCPKLGQRPCRVSPPPRPNPDTSPALRAPSDPHPPRGPSQTLAAPHALHTTPPALGHPPKPQQAPPLPRHLSPSLRATPNP